jgi:hypothetical protein
MRLAHRLPEPETLRAWMPALAGFAFGVSVPLVLAGFFGAMMWGGLSDTRAAPAVQAYTIETDG